MLGHAHTLVRGLSTRAFEMKTISTLIATSALPQASAVQAVCREENIVCEASQIVSFSSALPALRSQDQVTFVLICLSDNIAEALATIRELRLAFNKRIVAVGNSADPKLVIDTIRAGAHDFLDEGPHLAKELKDLISRIKQAEAAAQGTGRVIAVTASGGGLGTSFIASNLAAIFAQEEGACCLLDLAVSGGDQTTLLSLKPRYTLAELARNFSTLDSSMFEQSLTEHSRGIKLLANPRVPDHFHELAWPVLQDILRLARHTTSTVVMDIPDARQVEYQRAVAASDVVLLVFRLDFISVIRTRQIVEHLLDTGTDPGKLRLVANRGGQAMELPLGKVEKALGHRVTRCLPDDPATVNPSINLGNPVVFSAPESRVSSHLWSLASEVAGQELAKPGSNHALAGLTAAAAVSFMKLFPG